LAQLQQFLIKKHVIDALKNKLIILLLFYGAWLGAQHKSLSTLRVGLKLGYSVHTMSGDLTKTSVGANLLGGVWLQLKMSQKWTAQPELLMMDKGIGIRAGGKSPHFVNLHYFELPVLFQYHTKQLYYELGPSMAYLINLRENLFSNETPDLVNDYPFNRTDLSFNLGIGVSLNELWSLGLRLNHSLVPVRAAVPKISRASYNQLMAVSVTRQIKKKKKDETQGK